MPVFVDAVVVKNFDCVVQQIRGWWIWAYYLNPMTWTTYGLVASQLGDLPNLVAQPDGSLISIADYVRTALGFEHYYIGWCVLISFGWCFFFRVVSAISLQYLNFQTR